MLTVYRRRSVNGNFFLRILVFVRLTTYFNDLFVPYARARTIIYKYAYVRLSTSVHKIYADHIKTITEIVVNFLKLNLSTRNLTKIFPV